MSRHHFFHTVLLILAQLVILTPPLFAQWEPIVRLTYNDSESILGFTGSRVIGTNGDTLNIVWEDDRDKGGSNTGEIYFKQSFNGGLNWQPDTRLTYDSAWSQFPSIAVSGPFIHVFWDDNRTGNSEIYYKRSSDSGVTWSSDLRLTFDTTFSKWPSATIWGSNVYLVWGDPWNSNQNQNEIYFKKSTDSGFSWSQDTMLSRSQGEYHAYFPCITAWDSCLYLVWEQNVDGFTSYVFYKRSTNAGRTWSPDTQLNYRSEGLGPCISVSDSIVHIVWRDRQTSSMGVHYLRSTNFGRTWQSERQLTQSFLAWNPSIFASRSFVHLSCYDFNGPRIHYLSSSNNGSNWSPDTILTPLPATSYFPSISASGSIVHLVWYDYRDGNSEIYYMRNPTGNIGVAEQSGQGPTVKSQGYKVLPNPFASFATLPGHEAERFSLYDISGRKVGTYKGDRIGEGLAPGVYFVRGEPSTSPPVRIVKVR
jgi:hypothetical protein